MKYRVGDKIKLNSEMVKKFPDYVDTVWVVTYVQDDFVGVSTGGFDVNSIIPATVTRKIEDILNDRI